MAETCKHTDLQDDRREYCTVEAADPAGDILVVQDLMDELLYEKGSARSEEYRLSTDGRQQMLVRTVRYVEEHPEFTNAWPTNVELSLTHQTNKELGSEHYGVTVEYGVAMPGNTTRWWTQYFMDIFPQGKILTLIEEPDIVNGGYEERAMTGYDYVQLFNALNQYYEYQEVTT